MSYCATHNSPIVGVRGCEHHFRSIATKCLVIEGDAPKNSGPNRQPTTIGHLCVCGSFERVLVNGELVIPEAVTRPLGFGATPGGHR